MAEMELIAIGNSVGVPLLANFGVQNGDTLLATHHANARNARCGRRTSTREWLLHAGLCASG